MAAFLAKPGPAQNLDAARAILVAMVSETGSDGRRTRLEAAQLLGAVPDHFEQRTRSPAAGSGPGSHRGGDPRDWPTAQAEPRASGDQASGAARDH